jgi:hypothetical protein
VNIGVALHFRPREQVSGHPAGEREAARIEARRRGRAEIDRLGARLPGPVHHRVADAAEPGIPRLDRRECKRCRKCRIDRVAARIEHRDAGLRRILRLRHHHAALAGRGGFRELPVLGDVLRCEWHDRSE